MSRYYFAVSGQEEPYGRPRIGRPLRPDPGNSAASRICDEDSIELPPGALSLEFLQTIYRSAAQPMARRMKAASIAIQYESPKLAVTAVVNDQSIVAQLHRAIQRSAKVIELRAAQPASSYQPSAAEVSAAAVRRPMALIRRR